MVVFRRVVGDSMLPVLKAGQLIIAVRLRRAHAGDVVIARHNKLEKIKRVEKVSDGQLFLLGDNPERSTDSRHFGWLPEQTMIAKVVWPKTRRAGVE